VLFKFSLQSLQGAAGDVGEGLLRRHQRQIVIGMLPEQLHHLRHLDGLGPGAKHVCDIECVFHDAAEVV